MYPMDTTIDAVLARHDASSALNDPELAPLAVLAAQLRHAPSPAFGARLLAHLTRRTTMTTLVLEPTMIRESFTTVTPFVHPRGVPAYVEFLQRAFNAEVEIRAEHQGIVMHARLNIGSGAIEMGDTPGQSEPMRTGFYLYVPDADAVYAQAVAAGATPLSPPATQSYGDRMGSVMDAQGMTWFIAQPA